VNHPLSRSIATHVPPARVIQTKHHRADAHSRPGRQTSTSLHTCLPNACIALQKSGQSACLMRQRPCHLRASCSDLQLSRLTDHILTRGPFSRSAPVLNYYPDTRHESPWPRLFTAASRTTLARFGVLLHALPTWQFAALPLPAPPSPGCFAVYRVCCLLSVHHHALPCKPQAAILESHSAFFLAIAASHSVSMPALLTDSKPRK
jgi:hypothetical protein